MKLKKTFSIIMAFILLVGVVLPVIPVMGTGEIAHEHTYGQWSFDAENGTQSRVCSACDHTQVLYGTTNKASQAELPAVGESYYLAANVAGTLQYFTLEGSVTATAPYSLSVTDNLSNANIKIITLEDPKTTSEKYDKGFQLTFDNNGTTTRIYCMDVLKDASVAGQTGVMDTGAQAGTAYKNRHNFYLTQVGGVQVLKSTGNSNILVVKYFESTGTYRMLGVPEAELANEGVYPAMLVSNHTHSYGDEYEFDNTSHYLTCDCGYTSKEDHNFVEDVCICGATNTPHDCVSTDGKWHTDGGKHYQLCGQCGEKLQEAEHTYGNWIVDAQNGSQSKYCTVCQSVGQVLHGTANKVSQVTAPVVGESYYLIANVNGELLSFLANGGYTETSPYSLKTTTTLSTVTLNAALQAGKGEFQLVDATGKYIYSVAAGAGATTSTNYINNPDRVSFFMDEVNGVPVIRAFGTGNILVVKYSDAKSAWRMWCLPESELANAGVYPVMLANLHTHNYGTTYQFDVSQHWQSCDCGSISQKADHNFVVDPSLGYGVCVCGANLAPHECENTDGKWYIDGGKHYQLCGKCGQRIGEADHTYGAWTEDTQKGILAQYCTVCQAVGQTLHGTTEKVVQVKEPEIGGTYYLTANVSGKLLSFLSTGGYTETSPYSLKTTEVLSEVTLQAALQAGQGEFQLVDATGKYIYSVAAGAGATISENYIADPMKVSFSMDQVDGVPVIRAYGTGNILVVKYSETKNAWRMWCLPESELGGEGVYPVMLTTKHEHTYGEDWVTDLEKGTQSHLCTVCGLPGETLYGTGVKGYLVSEPKLGENYYLAANAGGKLIFFRHGTATDTAPYSLVATDNFNHNWVMPVTIEDPTTAIEGTQTGFQLTYIRPDNQVLTRIYCYDVLKDSDTLTGQTGVMDTGINTTNYKGRHTFMIDKVNGVTVLRKLSNNNILAVKYNELKGEWRMLGVPESELGSEGVYPAMLMTLHEHTHTDETYLKDETGHWLACDTCGGQSDFTEHTVAKWSYTTVPTQTTSGSKTGTCTLCGGTAVVEVPPMVAEGYYYLTGVVNGKTYYFRDKVSGESVEHTVPFSLMTTDAQKKALKVDIAWDEKSNTYILSYTVTRTFNIYMGDVAGSIIKEKDGHVDLASSATTSESLIAFKWDPATQMFYQVEGGIRYVIAFKTMTLTDGSQAVRMLAVPESELGGDVAPVQLQVVHIHQLGESWSSDAINHWQECSCGVRKNEGAHTVDAWTVEKNATSYDTGRKSGICTGCGQKVVNAIPMLTDHISAPVNGGKYYLTAVLGGVRYYFCHAPAGGSVADTYPYSLYTDPGTGKVTPVQVKISSGSFILHYGANDYRIYINGDGVGVTTKQDKALIEFQWDSENKVLYQMEGDAKYVLVLKKLRTNGGSQMVRITSMPLEQALIDPTVAIIRFSTDGPAKVDAETTAGAPEGATPLKYTTDTEAEEVILAAQTVDSHKLGPKEEQGTNQWIIAVIIVSVAIMAIILLMAVLKHSAWGLAFLRKRNVWAGLCMIAAGLVLAAAMILPSLKEETVPGLEAYTIVANDGSMASANELAVEIYEDYGISLPVVHCNDFAGDYGIYLNVSGFNSYGGYKYRISSSCNEETGTGIYIDGTGYGLDTAISKWTRSLKKANTFPFGAAETEVGYEWNTGDVNMTGLGFTLQEMNSRELYEGVELREMKYDSFAYGKNTGYAVIIDADAPVELKVSAGQWDENTNPDNPGEKHTVQEHGKLLTDAGYEVLAITNAGFYDLNTTMTYIPWGMQIVDGMVKKAPNKDNPKNTDNWFAQTADGKFVISNTDGYYETYETTLSDGVGGGLILMEDGKPCFTGTTPDYRTVVGITKEGDLVILTISGANYAVVTQAFMDMELDMECILNLDGGGSTTLHTLDENGKLKQFLSENPIEREVADAIAIVKKK